MSKEAESFDSGDSVLDLTGYRVIKGSKIGYMYDQNSAIELSNWMKSVRSPGGPIATYYFPEEQSSGPDVLFALQPPEHSAASTVLCLLQVSSRITPSAKLLTICAIKDHPQLQRR